MRKVASLYDNDDWEESESDITDEEFTYTTQLRKSFMFFKVGLPHAEILPRLQVPESEGQRGKQLRS